MDIGDIEDEIFASTVTDRVIKWANDSAEVDDFDTELDIAADVGDQSGISSGPPPPPVSDLQKLQSSIHQMVEKGMTGDPRYRQARQLSMDLFNFHCGELVTSLQTGGYSRGKH